MFKAPKKARRFKILLFGAPGVGKTYNALQAPGVACIDMEKGTDHYTQFNYIVEHTSNPREVFEIINNLVENPNIEYFDETTNTKKIFSVKTCVLDPIHLFEMAVEQIILEQRRKEEKDPSYMLTPQDYKMIKVEKKKLMLKLLNIDMNVFVCARTKDVFSKTEMMKIIGIAPDCDEQWLGYFDTILYIYIDKKNNSRMAQVYQKDRTNLLPTTPFEFSWATLAEYLKPLNFDADVNPQANINDEDNFGRNYSTIFFGKPIKTAGITGETLETITKLLKTEEEKTKAKNLLLEEFHLDNILDLNEFDSQEYLNQLRKLFEG